MQYNKIGKYIKNKRKSVSQTLNGFAINNDIEPAILSRVENLKQDIKLSILVKIAQGFGMTPAEFLLEFEQNQ